MGKEKIKNVIEVIHEKSQTVLLRRNFSTGQEAMNESETKAIVGNTLTNTCHLLGVLGALWRQFPSQRKMNLTQTSPRIRLTTDHATT